MRILIVDRDDQWTAFLGEALGQEGHLPTVQGGLHDALGGPGDQLLDYSAIVVSAELVPRPLATSAIRGLISRLEALGYRGRLVVTSLDSNRRDMRDLLGQCSLDAAWIPRSQLDVVAFGDLVGGTRPALENASSREPALVAKWQALVNGQSDPDGRLLEAAAMDLCEASELFFDLKQRFSDRCSEIDIVAKHFSSSRIFAPVDLVLFECKNTARLVTASQIRDFAGKLRAHQASLGIVICRAGLTGRNNSAALGLTIDLYKRGECNLISLDFPTCLRIASGESALETEIRDRLTELQSNAMRW